MPAFVCGGVSSPLGNPLWKRLLDKAGSVPKTAGASDSSQVLIKGPVSSAVFCDLSESLKSLFLFHSTLRRAPSGSPGAHTYVEDGGRRAGGEWAQPPSGTDGEGRGQEVDRGPSV